jgi:hypothetical protein
MKPRIGILTFARDAHGWAVKERLEQRHRAQVHVIGVDRLALAAGLHWTADAGAADATLGCASGERVAVGELGAIWDRRIDVAPQSVPGGLDDEDLQELVDKDCGVALDGVLASEFQGRWVSPPDATRAARNKLLQLRVASAVGLRVPRTIVSQDPDEVRDFCQSLGQKVVVRVPRGMDLGKAATPVDREILSQDEFIMLAPTIYQERIPGTRHVRVHCFGDRMIAVLLDTESSDWAMNLKQPVARYRLDPAIAKKISFALDTLRLRMAVVELKLDADGEPTWMELNPQGQFLWLEGLAATPLLDAFCDFLLEEARFPDVARRSSHRDVRHRASHA